MIPSPLSGPISLQRKALELVFKYFSEGSSITGMKFSFAGCRRFEENAISTGNSKIIKINRVSFLCLSKHVV